MLEESFQYGRFSFRPVFVEDTDLEVEDKRYQGHVLRVSSKGRTFLDCLDRVQYAGGWEERLKSSEGLRDLHACRFTCQGEDKNKDACKTPSKG